MRKFICTVLVIGTAVSLLEFNIEAQTPENRLPPNAGRSVKLKKIAVTHDENGNFIFKKPGNVLCVEDGSFFVIDNKKVLKFAAGGSFIKTVVNKGQGPGEATFLNQLYKRENELIVNTGIMRKLMIFDFAGELKNEHQEKKSKRFSDKGFGFTELAFRILAHREDGSLLALKPTIFQNKKEKIRKDGVFLLTGQNEWQERLFEIPMECIVVDLNGGEKLMLAKITLIYSSNRQFLYFSNTGRYEIKKYNIKTNKIESILKREYKPIPIPEELKDKFQYGTVLSRGSKNNKTKVVKPPQPKYFRDINKLFVVGDNLWVLTSVLDKEKGFLFDVFNRDGVYIDNFYINFPGVRNEADLINNKIHIFQNHLFTKETDEEGNYMVVKYEMVDSTPKASSDNL